MSHAGVMFGAGERRLGDSRVLVVGCGALGNEVLKNLVLLGVGHLVIVDFDIVEQSNLARSVLFRREDVGRSKTEVARDRLLDINPDLDVVTVTGDVAYDVGLGLFMKSDVVVGCVDSRWARYCIQRLCLRAGKTWVDGGILELEGTVRVFKPGCSCYACSLGPVGLSELRRRAPCSGLVRRAELSGHAVTTPISASVIGAVQAQEAVKVLAGDCDQDAGKMFYIDVEHISSKTALFGAWDDECELHGDQYEPVEIPHTAIDAGTPVRALAEYGTLLLDDPFVDYMVNSVSGEKVPVMLPARKVSDHIVNEPSLRGYPSGVFRTREWGEINADFPYPHLTLGEMGVPSADILRFRTDDGYRHVAMECGL